MFNTIIVPRTPFYSESIEATILPSRWFFVTRKNVYPDGTKTLFVVDTKKNPGYGNKTRLSSAARWRRKGASWEVLRERKVENNKGLRTL